MSINGKAHGFLYPPIKRTVKPGKVDLAAKGMEFNDQRQHRFQMISPLKTKYNQEDTDLLEQLIRVKPAAQIVFIEIKRTRNFVNNIAHYPAIKDDENKNKYSLFRKRVRQLIQNNLLMDVPAHIRRRLRLNEPGFYFLINPHLIRCKNHQEACNLWKTTQN